MTILTETKRHAHEQRSAVLVFIVTVLALLAGWGVMTAVTHATTSVSRQGITAAAPAGWLVQEGTGDLIMVIRNPGALDELYRVSLLPEVPDLEAAAFTRGENRARQEAAFQIQETTPIVFDGRDGYKFTYAFADDSGAKPVIVEGVDYYFPEEAGTLVLSFEAETDDFARDFPAFQQFMRSISLGSGG
jgi:hypothetical protein